jgi:hypothetical protein
MNAKILILAVAVNAVIGQLQLNRAILPPFMVLAVKSG